MHTKYFIIRICKLKNLKLINLVLDFILFAFNLYNFTNNLYNFTNLV